MKTTQNSGWAGAGLLTAAAASLCCITPLLAFLTGISSVAAAFSWMEPFRPVLIAITLFVLFFAWYQRFKPQTAEQAACDCNAEKKPSFFQSNRFLSIITAVAFVLLAFPYYGQIFYHSNNLNEQNSQVVPAPIHFQKIRFSVRGMTCQSCEKHIEHNVQQLKGINKAQADSQNGTASISFDPLKTSKEQLVKAINSSGYQVQSEIK